MLQLFFSLPAGPAGGLVNKLKIYLLKICRWKRYGTKVPNFKKKYNDHVDTYRKIIQYVLPHL